MRYLTRLKKLEERLLPDPKPPVLMFVIFDGDVPEWASEAIQPHTDSEGVTVVTWRQDTEGAFYAEIRGSWYHVTPDGCPRVETPDLITFSVGPDSPRTLGDSPGGHANDAME